MDSPVERIRLEGTDPTDWRTHGLRKLVRGYVEGLLRWPQGAVLLLPDPEYPIERPKASPFARVERGRPVAAVRIGAGGAIEVLGVASPPFEPRVRRCLDAPARLAAIGLPEGERGAESVVAFAMNLYDEFGLHVTFVPVA